MGSKRKSGSRSRSRSRSKRQTEPETASTASERIYANFVIPLAGIVSTVAARLYDMGASPSKPQPQENGSGNATGDERTPLLPQAERGPEGNRVPTTKRVKRWFATNAVLVFMTLLIAAIVIILCVFFGSEYRGTPLSPYCSRILARQLESSRWEWRDANYYTVYRSKQASAKATVCTTAACVHAASEILYNLSPDYQTLDACTDFEQLVCEGWDNRHDLRPDQGDAFTGTIMSENSQMLLRHILEAPYPEYSEVRVQSTAA